MGTPAVLLDGQVIVAGRVPKVNELNTLLLKAKPACLWRWWSRVLAPAGLGEFAIPPGFLPCVAWRGEKVARRLKRWMR